jgi:hypothetical protein
VIAGCAGGGSDGDDAFEPNDDFTFAYALDMGVRLTDISPEGGMLTPIDSADYYLTEEPGPAVGDTMLVYCEFDEAADDCDIYLYNPSHAQVASSAGATGDYEMIRHTVATSAIPNRHYIRVKSDGAADVTYDLWYYQVPSDESDPYEPNDDWASSPPALAEATWLSDTIGEPGWGVAHRLATDGDWYELTVTTAGTLVVTCDFYHNLGDVDVFLHDSVGAGLNSAESTTDGEVLSKSGVSAGTYYVRVELKDTETVDFNAYDLHWEVQ